MYLGTNFMPPVIHPTQQLVNNTFSTTIVPHIHPVHTTTVNHHMYQHKHYCPESASCAEDVCNQHINCCNPCAPGIMPAAYAAPGVMPAANVVPGVMPAANAIPSFGMGGPGGPGFGPGGPGFAPGPFMGPRPY